MYEMSTEPSSLRDYLARYMAKTGVSQAEIARASGLSESDISGIMKGRINLPGPNKRRDLAKALGVSHLDILIAAGEILPEEIRPLGVTGVTDEDPKKAALIDMIRRLSVIDGSAYLVLEGSLATLLRFDRKAARAVDE